MAVLSTVVGWLGVVAIPLLLLRAYLDLNKKWSRKHIPEVAESISVASHALISLQLLVFLAQSLLQARPSLIAINLIGLAWNTTIIVIASGVFVSGNRGEGFWRLLGRALRLERAESTNLLRTFSNPKGAREILAVLEGVAAADDMLDPAEIDLINQFAAAWRVPTPALMPGRVPERERVTLSDVRGRVERYLAVEPPPEQAEQLIDLLRVLVMVDGELDDDEAVLLDEVSGLVGVYADDVGAAVTAYEVRIVPQSDEQRRSVTELLPAARTTRVAGAADVVIVGRFYSERYAEVISQRYRDLGLFTVAELTEGAAV